MIALACGSRGELLGTLGVSADAAVGPDAMAAQTPRFSPPQVVTALSDPNARDGDPTFTGDLLELYFVSDRGGGSADLWVSRRMASDDPWGPPLPVSELNSFFAETGPTVSLDGLRIWFATDRDFSFGKIWRSSRPSRAAPWAPPQVVGELATQAKDFGPTVDATETTMMFGSNRPGSFAFDLHASRRPTANGPWGPVRRVPGANSNFDDWDPFVAQGGLIIFFTSMRQGMGDIFWSARQSIAEAFAPPLPLVDVNSTAYDSDATLSQDLTYMLFDSMRSGDSEIYESFAVR